MSSYKFQILTILAVVVPSLLGVSFATVFWESGIDNLIWESGTSFNGTFDHANTANRVYTLPDVTGTLDIAYPEDYSYIMYQNGTSSTWILVNGTTGLIEDSGTDEQQILQDAIDDICGAIDRSNTGKIFIKTPYSLFNIDTGITVSSCESLSIEGETFSNYNSGPPNKAVRFWSSVDNTNFIEYTNSDHVILDNIEFSSAGTNQTALLLKDSVSNSIFDNLAMVDDFEQGIWCVSTANNTLNSGNTFGRIRMSGVQNGIILDGTNKTSMGNNQGCTVFSFGHITIAGANETGVWFKEGADNHYFNFLHIPSGSGVDVQIGKPTNDATGVAGNVISELHTGSTNEHIRIYDDDGQEVQTPLTVFGWNPEGSGTLLTVDPNARRPVWFNGHGNEEAVGLNVEKVIIDGTHGTPTLMDIGTVDVPTEGALVIPVNAGVPTDAEFGDMNGGLGVDTTNDRLYFRSGGNWIDSTIDRFTFSGNGDGDLDFTDFGFFLSPIEKQSTSSNEPPRELVLPFNGVFTSIYFQTGSSSLDDTMELILRLNGANTTNILFIDGTDDNIVLSTSFTEPFSAGDTMSVLIAGNYTSGSVAHRGISIGGYWTP